VHKLQRLKDLLSEVLEWATMPPELRERIERELGDNAFQPHDPMQHAPISN
jgi:hypothetical protein